VQVSGDKCLPYKEKVDKRSISMPNQLTKYYEICKQGVYQRLHLNQERFGFSVDRDVLVNEPSYMT
jgi:hypothetical protein